MRHIALVGFMGSGKSTIGKALARRLGWPLVDTDAEIVRKHGPIDEIFLHEGEHAFRGYEEAAVARAIDSDVASVVAVGGGAPLHAPTGRILREGAYRVFLSVSVETIESRVRKSQYVRPVLGGSPTREQINELYRKRLPVYESSDAVVDCEGLGAEEAAQRIYDRLRDAEIVS